MNLARVYPQGIPCRHDLAYSPRLLLAMYLDEPLAWNMPFKISLLINNLLSD